MSNYGVNRFPRLFRFLKYGAVLALGVLLTTALLIHVQQRILRGRAEQLLADVRSLELRKATFEDAQQVFRRWRGFGQYHGQCAQQHCTFEVTLQDIVFRCPGPCLFLLRIDELLGGRPARMIATIGVQNGVVWEKSFAVDLIVWPFDNPQGYTSEYMLMGSADSVSRFPPPQQWGAFVHPNYIVGRPGGCEGCLAVYARFTPYADPADVQRLMQFNLSCLTRWKRCLVPGDIMPDVWAEQSREEANYEKLPVQAACGSQVVEMLGRDAEDAGIVEVLSRRSEAGSDGHPIQVFTVRLAERLKRATLWEMGATRDLPLFENDFGLAAPKTLSQVRPGSRFILLFTAYPLAVPKGHDVWVENCGVIPFSESHLELVRRGIKQDYEAAEEDEAHALP